MDKDILKKSRILPVIVIEDAQDAVPLAEALLAGGLSAIEVTFRTTAAAESIRLIRDNVPEMTVSAGTVLTLDQAQAALDSGAQFCLSPGLDSEVVTYVLERSIPFVPGVMTPSEVQAALKLDCQHLKFFPAGAAGGVKMLKSIAAPFKSMGVQFCPTGGLNLENMAEYLALSEVFTIGGSWLAPSAQIAAGDWTGITENVRAAVDQIPAL
ncbi:MAG: bifunctional 4-hydroxy-2-oxoglutarate aldolase/2-dehydro-3-deoxy-phosphogluconate aldolase [Opitutales bacterium]|nr:bifunctional 4-hydroxy-2-oxoglutarate aldolase/2-dehydro-3-deoxy-phosphogluconate aldolase [Opitutales bacterium]NRA28005.1 bifunctional 4-hydroxy-2-oxoglutarate aldolase/2-dehydro-3-deoxy-phosphogluconate aldolase [Opitutales bacterium]